MKTETAAAVLALAASAGAFAPRALPHRMVMSPPKATIEVPLDVAPGWRPDSWRSRKAYQMPEYNDGEKLADAERILARQSPLVFAGECRDLHQELVAATNGQGFLLMGGDCAESFQEFNVNHVRDTFRVILQMALIMTFGGAMPITKIGRMAGQFAKPRSDPYEDRKGVKLPSYRGDIVNGEEFTAEARENDPYRMVAAYHQSSQTLNILRAFATGGYADISRLHAWNLDFVDQTEPGSRYRQMATKVDESMRFMKAIGVDTADARFKQTKFYTAHECLLLPYEQSLTRLDSTTGKWYDCSAHMVWVGERTRQLDAAHLEFVRGIGNPLGVKISDKCTPDELLQLLDVINPTNTPGRVTLITRMNPDKLRKHLPELIRAVQREGRQVLWISDPVHGNTIKTDSGYKTRPFDKIRAELRAFFDVHAEMGSHAGGVHVEMTGEDVTECIGGSVSEILEADLAKRYHTYCDPRLNGMQSLELAFLIADRMRKDQGLPPLAL
ncbi:3-deoxy-7-phosphoheptulonate synthase [Tribonema minus]|uniref:Phospho-2-dehydro-3-deoxyheptonate aldolase n=1 Tax=Tribonema minus TaxID=303371 RepID=A0A835Z444_9STRA|nr:3-deoxy-7-phosphoheptulonate synthase [Tribonema minus]